MTRGVKLDWAKMRALLTIGLTAREVAREMPCSHFTVKRLREEWGIESRAGWGGDRKSATWREKWDRRGIAT